MATNSDVAALRQAAGDLERKAAAVEQLASEIARQLRFRWESVFAERFRSAAESRCRLLNQLDERLRSAANQLRDLAARLEAELARLDALERAVRAAVEKIAESGGVPPRFPPSGSPEWELLSRSLPSPGGR